MKYSYRILAVISIIVFCLSIQLLQAGEIKEFTKKFKNGKTYIQSKKIQGILNGFIVTTYYDNDKLMKTEEWRNNKRNGITKVYNKDGSLLKEIKFVDNYVLEYKAYKNGSVETQISEDRTIIVNKGRKITADWDKYYELWNGNFIAYFDKMALVHFLLNYVLPEEATEIFSDITDFFKSAPGAGQNGMDDMMTCGGSTSLFKDNNIDLLTSVRNSSRSNNGINTQPSGKGKIDSKASTIQNNVLSMLNTCSDNIRENSSVGGRGGNLNQTRTSDINNANRQIEQMISECESRRSSNNMFAVSPAELMGLRAEFAAAEELLANAPTVIKNVGTVAGESGGVFAEKTVEGVALHAAEGSAVRTATGNVFRGFITAGTASTIAGVTTAAVVGWTIGTAINDSFIGKAITQAVAKWQESNDSELNQASKEAQETHQESEQRATNNSSSSTPSASMPTTDDIGNGDVCQRMENFKNYCNHTQWKDLRCEEFIRFNKKCAGDIRQIYVNPEGGSLMNTGCKLGGDPAALREAECKRKGMIARPGGNEPGGICANKKVEPVMGGPDQRVINPTRGDFSIPSVSGVNIELADDGDEASLLSSTKPTLVIFADPDCGFCNEMTKTLTSKSVSTSLSAYDVKFVDVNMSPKLAQKFGVEIVPSYFVAKSGKKSTLQAGAMDEKSMTNYLNDNKSGPTSNTK
jgi:antitoxin component YwqK of YwqJK toxin-antitoxin module